MDQIWVDVKPQSAAEMAPLFDVGVQNAKTMEVIRELEAGGGTGFGSVEALMADLEADD